MANQNLSFITVSAADSAVTFAGDWNPFTPSGFRNASHPEIPISVTFTFHGIQALVDGSMDLNEGHLLGSITWDSSGRSESIQPPPSFNPCIAGDPSEPCSSNYTTETLSCDRYTLNLTVMSHQWVQIEQFGFIPCAADATGDSVPYTTVLTTPASSSTSVSVSSADAEKKQSSDSGVIAGAVIGTLIALALCALAFFIFLRRRNRSRASPSSSPSSSPSPSPPLFKPFSRSRPWFRLSDSKPKPNTSFTPFLVPFYSFSPAAALGDNTSSGRGRGLPTTLLDAAAYSSTAAAAASASAAQAQAPPTTGLAVPTLPWLIERSSAYYPSGDGSYAGDAQLRHASSRDGEDWGETEKQPLRSNYGADLESGGMMAVTHGYLSDSKELIARQEREQAEVEGVARMPGSPEALPRYESRGSLRWSP